jgi:hypothetical protein
MSKPADETFQKPGCPVCGGAVPFFTRWNISIFRAGYCPACSNAVTFGRVTLITQLILYFATIPMFYLVFGPNSWFGYLGLAAILALSALISSASKLRPVSSRGTPTVGGRNSSHP